MERARLLTFTILLAIAGLTGCAGAVVVGGTAGTLAVAHDRRTPGTILEDETIELKAYSAIGDDPGLEDQAHVRVTSYNMVVLLTGEAPTASLRERAERLVAAVPRVRRVYNEIRVEPPSSFSTRTRDAWLAAKVKVRLFDVDLEDFDPLRVKVISSHGTVYLMGLLTRAEADAVVEVVRTTGGVEKVVKLFEYLG